MHGEQWSREEHLLAGIYDVLALANWQRQNRRGAPKPKALPRPGTKPQERRFGTASMTVDEWRTRYAARFEGRDDGS